MDEAFEEFMQKVINPANVVIRGKYKISRNLAHGIQNGVVGKVLPYKPVAGSKESRIDVVIVTSASVFDELMKTTFVNANTVLVEVLAPIFDTLIRVLEQKPLRCGIVGNHDALTPIFAGHITYGMLNQYAAATFEEDVLAVGLRLDITTGQLAVTLNAISVLDESTVIAIVNQIS